MNPEQQAEVIVPLTKLASVWALVGVSTLQEAATLASLVAASMASFYTLLLITQWWIKYLWRPLFARYGWFGVTPKNDD